MNTYQGSMQQEKKYLLTSCYCKTKITLGPLISLELNYMPNFYESNSHKDE